MFIEFRYNEARTKIQCRVCSAGVTVERRTWIEVRSAPRHLLTPAHLRAVELNKEKQRRTERLEKEREVDSATSNLREVEFTTPHTEPVASASSRASNEAEAEMWADYRMNGAEFSAGDDIEHPEATFQRLREEAEIFGLWNPEATVRKLGFGDDNMGNVVEEDEEDDFLGEIMRNAGEYLFV